jgi:hypothetical protein
MAKFAFDDLSSFRDYIGFVQVYSPDAFPDREGLSVEEQWSLDLAFDGLRHGIESLSGGGEVSALAHGLVNSALVDYRAGRDKDADSKLEEFRSLLRRFSTRR